MGLGIGIGLRFGSNVPIFDPLSVAGLTQDLWAQPNLVTLAGSKVATWTERSGAAGASNGTQGTDANRPAYNASGINGRPSIDFGSATWLALAMSKVAGDHTIFVVHQPDGIIGTGGGTGQYMLDFATGRLVIAHLSATVSGALGYYDGAFRTVAAASGAQILAFRLNATGGNSASIRRNGATILSGQAYTQRALGGAVQSIGSDSAHAWTTAGQYFGKIGRVAIYSGNLSDANVQIVERGLGRYYGITVA